MPASDKAAAPTAPRPAAPQATVMRPHLKAGLWQINMTSDTAFGAAMSGQLCVDAQTESAGFKIAPGAKGADCTEPKFAASGSGLMFDVACRAKSGRLARAHGTASGDFSNSYRLDATSTFDPPLPAGIGSVHGVMTARWNGACPAGAKPGQLSMKFGGLGQG